MKREIKTDVVRTGELYLNGELFVPSTVRYHIQHVPLTAQHILDQGFDLDFKPLGLMNVAMDVIGGGPQAPGIDFSLTGKFFGFLGDLAEGDPPGVSALIEGDMVRLQYLYDAADQA